MSTYQSVTGQLRTIGISPKAILAFAFPALATVVGAVCDWIISGQLDHTAIRVAISGLLASALAALGAYVGRPGSVTREDGTTPPTARPPVAS
jgi:hypothetical protein